MQLRNNPPIDRLHEGKLSLSPYGALLPTFDKWGGDSLTSLDTTGPREVLPRFPSVGKNEPPPTPPRRKSHIMAKHSCSPLQVADAPPPPVLSWLLSEGWKEGQSKSRALKPPSPKFPVVFFFLINPRQHLNTGSAEYRRSSTDDPNGIPGFCR